MIKYQKIFLTGICFLIFLFAGFFCLYATNKISAANLEVQYPTIAGQNINTEVNLTLPSYVKYLFNAGVFLGFFAVFISLIVAGVMYILSPVSVQLRADAKDRVSGAISGLLILTLTYLIITTINPQLSILRLNELPPLPPPPAEKKSPGVYLYNSSDCSDTRIAPKTSNVPDLGPQRNKVNSVGIVQDPDTKTSYISILYDNTELWGMCQYIDPNKDCQSVSPFASSASVHVYDFDPNGDGVYFYRRSYFDGSGGYYKIPNSEIKGIYIGKLEDLKFEGVPEKEKDCVKYKKSGECAENGRNPPSLAGENISSVMIHVDYLVLFVYFGPNDPRYGPWTSCQEFPVADDVNKIGPQQIKWQNIRNNKGVVPNYVVVIPIHNN